MKGSSWEFLCSFDILDSSETENRKKLDGMFILSSFFEVVCLSVANQLNQICLMMETVNKMIKEEVH